MEGIRVVEIGSIGPGPFAGMLLAHLGADVLRIERPFGTMRNAPEGETMVEGRPSLLLDLKSEHGSALALQLVSTADVLLEGFRPGVLERLGLGPAEALAANPRLVYGRVTGWGQTGPLSDRAGHDINYLALSGALAAIGPPERPAVPLNLIADFGGGGMLVVVGVLAAVIAAKGTGRGQVVDAAMVDGASLLMTMMYELSEHGLWTSERQANLLDGGSPFYGVYETSDGGFVAVGALEPKFFAELVSGLGLDEDWTTRQYDPSSWPELRAALVDAFLMRTRDEWAVHFAQTDACVAPVLDMGEAPGHQHNQARSSFVDGRPAAAPRFSPDGQHWSRKDEARQKTAAQFLYDAGMPANEVEALRAAGAISDHR